MIGIIDIETTDFFKNGGKIVEVGIAGLDLETGNVTELFNSVCREDGLTAKDRKAWIFQNSSLLVEDVRFAPSFESIKPKIQSVIDLCDGVTAFNKAFDFEFFKDRGIIIINELDCPMLLAKDVLKLPPKNKWAKDYKWPSVEEAWRYFFPDVPYVEEHRGLDDAIHEAKIVHKLYNLGYYRSV